MASLPKKRKPTKAAVSAAWREFYETPEGRVAVGAFMAKYGVYSQMSATDPTSLAIQVGERNAAAWLAEQCGLQPSVYVQERSDLDRIFEPTE